jgi:hypothetical protein
MAKPALPVQAGGRGRGRELRHGPLVVVDLRHLAEEVLRRPRRRPAVRRAVGAPELPAVGLQTDVKHVRVRQLFRFLSFIRAVVKKILKNHGNQKTKTASRKCVTGCEIPCASFSGHLLKKNQFTHSVLTLDVPFSAKPRPALNSENPKNSSRGQSCKPPPMPP